jgi:hypothetical protein
VDALREDTCFRSKFWVTTWVASSHFSSRLHICFSQDLSGNRRVVTKAWVASPPATGEPCKYLSGDRSVVEKRALLPAELEALRAGLELLAAISKNPVRSGTGSNAIHAPTGAGEAEGPSACELLWDRNNFVPRQRAFSACFVHRSKPRMSNNRWEVNRRWILSSRDQRRSRTARTIKYVHHGQPENRRSRAALAL